MHQKPEPIPSILIYTHIQIQRVHNATYTDRYNLTTPPTASLHQSHLFTQTAAASSELVRPSCEPRRHGLGRAGTWAAGSKRQRWFTGQACSFTREISRATINTTVSFKGAVYHTTGFQGPQTDLVFVVFFFFFSPPPPLLSNCKVAWVWIQLNVSLPSSISSDC